MTTLAQTIIKAHYAANEQQIEALARDRATHQESLNGADTIYHRAYITMMQSRLGRPTRGRGRPVRAKGVGVMKEAQLAVMEAVDKVYYAAVMRGIITPDIAHEDGLDKDEQKRRTIARNNRTNFARSTKSEIRYFIEHGGDIRTIDAKTISKNALRRSVQPPEPADKIARQISRAQGSLLRALDRRARGSPDEARADIENVMDALETLLNSLGGETEEETTEETVTPARRATDQGPARTRVGIPTMMHRGAS